MTTAPSHPASPPDTGKILVWDFPTRVFHWLLAGCFVGAYLTGESESWRLVHLTLGYSLAGLILFRIAWGLAGTRYARFSSFSFGFGRVKAYLGSLLRRQPEHHVGHNPAGALAIFGMLSLGLAVSLSGYALFQEIGGEAFEEVHELLANLMLALVGVHIAGVVVSSLLHRENLPRAMVSGYKTGAAAQGIASPRWIVGGLLLAAVLGFWTNLGGVRDALVGSAAQVAAAEGHEHADDDDDD